MSHILDQDQLSRGDALGFSWNPLHYLAKAASGLKHLEGEAITSVADLVKKVTPKDLQKILYWSPYGLAIRAGAKVSDHAKQILEKAVKWLPGEKFMYNGAVHTLSTLTK